MSKPWTPEDIATAVAMRRELKSSQQIAVALGRSRNAVIGALWRAWEPGVLRSITGRASENGKPTRRAYSWERTDG